MIEPEHENKNQIFRYPKLYFIIGIVAVCAALPYFFENYLTNKEENLAVSYDEAPMELVLFLSIVLILIGWYFSKSKLILSVCTLLLVISNGLLLQTYIIVNVEGIERRSYFLINNDAFKWGNVKELNFTVKLGNDANLMRVNQLKTMIVPNIEIVDDANETREFSGFTIDELLDLKQWLKTQSEPKSYIQPIPNEYYDDYYQMNSSELEKVNQFFEIKTRFNEKPILLN
nr:hypothetical protein [Lysinibacillus timonensis]